VEAGIHLYRVGTEIPRLLATSRGGIPLARSFLADLILLSVICRLRPPAPELACNFQAGAGSFDGEFALHLRQAGHHVKEEASGRRARIDRVREALELNALVVKFSYEID